MIKLDEHLELKVGNQIRLPKDWQEKITEILKIQDFPSEFSMLGKLTSPKLGGTLYIFESQLKEKKNYKIALSNHVVKYLFGTEVPDTNIGFSFKECLPAENTEILITNVRNLSVVHPALFHIDIKELDTPNYGKMLYLDFQLDFLNGTGFTSINYYTRANRATWKFLFHSDISYMTDFEKMFQDTYVHKKYVIQATQKLADHLRSLGAVEHAEKLLERGIIHDNSKISCEEELRALSMIINDKSSLRDAKVQLSQIKKECIKLHWEHNTHHPEHYNSCIDMPRLDIQEMVCDWYARSLQYETNFLEYVQETQELRFHFPGWMFSEIWYYCEVLAK